MVLDPPAAGRSGKAAPAPPAPVDDFVRYNPPMNFLYQTYHTSAMGPPWSTLTAYDLNSDGIPAVYKAGAASTLRSASPAARATRPRASRQARSHQ